MKIREYPLFYGDTINVTYNEVRQDEPEMTPKEAWNWAEHLHRIHPRNQEKVQAIAVRLDKLLAF